ncbi:hypothetical protein AWJ20_485 [Sugiyamaella lignohabitans]|uniref:Uncharacterized protein n=1 Tax=Sugiyamaella lignohabitans TaxID=796027 RepID=A0A167CXS4_9ASCO|nr:uncharacterized protein AWJ20_485 [Sugiyamaella lignohabitans]ANB12236.1 hypothetical protein AWJ20_485 [Sugiyamaella lignohabitans]
MDAEGPLVTAAEEAPEEAALEAAAEEAALEAALEAAEEAAEEAADEAADEAPEEAALEAADEAALEAADEAADEAALEAADEAADEAALEAADEAAEEEAAEEAADELAVHTKPELDAELHETVGLVIVDILPARIPIVVLYKLIRVLMTLARVSRRVSRPFVNVQLKPSSEISSSIASYKVTMASRSEAERPSVTRLARSLERPLIRLERACSRETSSQGERSPREPRVSTA